MRLTTEPAFWSSFRDPSGRLVRHHGRLLRCLNPSGALDWRALAASRTYQEWIAAGYFPATRELPLGDWPLPGEPASASSVLLEHDPLPLASFACEWPAEMLFAAACTTLDLAESLHREGLGLKDATPDNVLFRGPKAVFIDLASCERRDRTDPTWWAAGQFTRTFLLPLWLHQVAQAELAPLFLTHRDGLDPGEALRAAGFWRSLSGPGWSLARVPDLLSRQRPQPGLYRKRQDPVAGRADFILGATLRRLQRQLRRLKPRCRVSAWSEYSFDNSYDAAARARKHAALDAVLSHPPSSVLDLGSNSGEFALRCAAAGAETTAIDRDPAVIGTLWEKAAAGGLPVLPLVVDIARPTPAVGWNNQEFPSFLERTRGHFDLVLCLALSHHVLIGERVSPMLWFELLAGLCRDRLLIEFVDPSDAMCQALFRGRESLYDSLDRSSFEAGWQRWFNKLREWEVTPTRRLYLLKRQAASL